MEQSKFYQIKNVTGHEYTLVGCDGSVITRPIQDVDKSASAFTIQDAKDGDVLAVEPIDDYQFPFIAIYENRGLNFFNSYCSMGFDGKFYEATTGHALDNLYPASKDQRDLLFQKMHEAGYMWDSKSKQLLSLKAEPSGKQKPAGWSEEDERMYQNMLNPSDLRPQSHWKPSQEQMYMLEWLTTNVLDNGVVGNKAKEVLYTLIEQLKSL